MLGILLAALAGAGFWIVQLRSESADLRERLGRTRELLRARQADYEAALERKNELEANYEPCRAAAEATDRLLQTYTDLATSRTQAEAAKHIRRSVSQAEDAQRAAIDCLSE